MRIFDKMMYIILYLIGFFIIGLVSFIQPGVGFKKLDWVLILDNLLTYAAIVCIILATLLNVIDKFKAGDKEYLEADATIKSFASSKEYVPSIFSRFCSFTNDKRKRKQFEFNIKKELSALESKASESDFYVWNRGTQEQKKANKYCVTREMLEHKLSEEWIERNLYLMNIKYDRISSAIVLSGVYSKKENESPNDFITKGKGSKLAREKIPYLLVSFAITCLTSSAIITMAVNPSVLLNLAVKTMVLCSHTFQTIRYANTWKEVVTLKDIRWRKGIVTEYYKWLSQEAENTQENNETVIENSIPEECIEQRIEFAGGN